MRYYIINVEGEIVANEKKHYAQNWTCGSIGEPVKDDIYEFDEKNSVVKGNLILNRNKRAVPYAIYCTAKGIVATNGGDVVVYPGYGAAWEYYKENIDKIVAALNIEVAEDISQPLYRGLFTEVFSALELFLSDFMLCLIYTNEEIFEKAKVFFCTKKDKNGQSIVRNIESKMHKFFFDEVVYHRFDEVKKMCKEILQIKIPDTEGLKQFLYKRNNIVHRYSFSNRDRMCVCTITRDDVLELIGESNVFVEKLIENYEKMQCCRTKYSTNNRIMR